VSLKNAMDERAGRAAGRVGLREMHRQAAQAQTGEADTTVWIPLEELVVDEQIQVRQNGLDPERVQQYATAMIEYGGWGSFPPLDVFRDPETNELRIAGGFHREGAVPVANRGLAEANKNPITEAPCKVRTGGINEAIEFAEEDNLKHGLNLTARDKRGIFERRMGLPEHPWTQFSNVRWGAELGVDEGTIRNWRKAFSSLTSEFSEVRETKGKKAPEKRIGKDGRPYRIDRVQKASRKRAQKKAKETTPEPARDLDESEPARQWQDERPAQPRGLYRSAGTASPRPAMGAADDSVPTEQDKKHWIVSQLRKLAGMVGESGEPESARTLIGEANTLAGKWRIGR
jgi:hypothetical protein